MLTQQHRYASKLISCDQKKTYRLHMCGLCHALGDGYGYLSRLLTSHEMILLNMLTSAQMLEAPVETLRRCPLNPLIKVRTNQNAASQFAAAAAVTLTQISVQDDVVDSGGSDLTARLINAFLHRPSQKAMASLHTLGFDTQTFQHLTADQPIAEHDESADPAAPTAATSAKLFAETARIAGLNENTESLAIIGAQYGAYLYLMDAYRDYPQDRVRGEFNPLRRFIVQEGDTFSIMPAGLRWLRIRFDSIRTTIAHELKQVSFRRYQRNLSDLLMNPLDAIIAELDVRLERETVTAYRERRLPALLRAALCILPGALAASSILKMQVSPNEDEVQTELNEVYQKGKRRKHSDGDLVDQCCCSCDTRGSESMCSGFYFDGLACCECCDCCDRDACDCACCAMDCCEGADCCGSCDCGDCCNCN